jgi:hypothetical protein
MNDNIDHPVIKVASAWAAVGITSWAEAASAGTFFASALAAIYTFALLCEWFWKRLWKPLFTHYGWFGFERRAKDAADSERPQ